MNELLTYMIGELRNSSEDIRAIKRILVRQKTMNDAVVIFAFVTTMNVILTNTLIKAHRAKIEELNAEVEKLKKGD